MESLDDFNLAIFRYFIVIKVDIQNVVLYTLNIIGGGNIGVKILLYVITYLTQENMKISLVIFVIE